MSQLCIYADHSWSKIIAIVRKQICFAKIHPFKLFQKSMNVCYIEGINQAMPLLSSIKIWTTSPFYWLQAGFQLFKIYNQMIITVSRKAYLNSDEGNEEYNECIWGCLLLIVRINKIRAAEAQLRGHKFVPLYKAVKGWTRTNTIRVLYIEVNFPYSLKCILKGKIS